MVQTQNSVQVTLEQSRAQTQEVRYKLTSIAMFLSFIILRHIWDYASLEISLARSPSAALCLDMQFSPPHLRQSFSQSPGHFFVPSRDSFLSLSFLCIHLLIQTLGNSNRSKTFSIWYSSLHSQTTSRLVCKSPWSKAMDKFRR